MSLAMSNEEKIIADYIISTGSVPQTITIELSDYLTHSDVHEIEDFANSNGDAKVKTFVNNILKDNR